MKLALPMICLAAIAATPAFAQSPAPAAATSAAAAPAAQPVIQVDAGKVAGKISPTLYGLMTEEINHSYDGGLYAELIQNRSFKDDAKGPVHWTFVGSGGNIALDPSQPVANTALTTSLKIDASGAAAGNRAGAANDGYWGIPVRPNTTYRLSFFAKGATPGGVFTATIEPTAGGKPVASVDIPAITSDWKKYTATLTTPADVAPSANYRFVIATEKPGTYWLNLVSLFPPTYNDRPNGMRSDIMELLIAMKPKFLRLPGGNFLEGPLLGDQYPWKQTLGALDQRPGHNGSWGYRPSDGMGLLEYMEWCEDMHAEPVLAVYAGYALKRQHIDPGPALQPFVDDAIDEIEYVTGDTSTKWGARRAADGHPAPFPLHYVEIGNEDGFDNSHSYDGRFAQFYDAIKKKYPDLKCIATAGGRDGLGAREKVTLRTPDVIDEHYYCSALQMMGEANRFDKYPRTGAKVFAGEWATREGSPTTNLIAAVADSAWMCGMERNGDLVILASYAPLFVNVEPGGMEWKSDLIGYDTMTSYGSPSYYAQKMYSDYLGDTILGTSSQNIATQTWQPPTPRASPRNPNPVAPPARQVPTLFYSATRDTGSGKIYLKLVNGTAAAITPKIQISGAGTIQATGSEIRLTSANPTDTNTITEPTKITPATSDAKGLGADFDYALPPFSVTILVLNAK